MAGRTRYVILGLLSEGPQSGYDLKRIIETRFRFFWNESYGQIYPQIRQLEQERKIRKLDTPDDVRNKQLYAITDLGVKDLRGWMKEPDLKESIRLELLLKVYFAKFASPAVLREHIQAFAMTHEDDLAQLRAFQNELKNIPDPHHNHQDILNVIEFGVKTNLAYLDWCDMMIETLGGLNHDQSK